MSFSVYVYCNMDSFSLDVCYKPHDDVDVTSPGFMYVAQHRHDDSCIGRSATAQDPCPQDDSAYYTVSLPMGRGQRDQCGTTEIVVDVRICGQDPFSCITRL